MKYLILLVLLIGCKPDPKEARKELNELGVKFTENGLINSVLRGDKVAVKLFIDSGFNLNTSRSDGVTPLCAAADQKQLEILKVLVNASADPNLKCSRSGYVTSPLLISIQPNNEDVFDFLIESGAKFNGRSKYGMSELSVAVANNSVSIVKYILKNNSALTKQEVSDAIFQASNDDVIELLRNFKK